MSLRSFLAVATAVAIVQPATAAPLRLLGGDTDIPAIKRTGEPPRSGVHVVQAAGRASELRIELDDAGVRVLGYVPDDAWIVRLDAESAKSVTAMKSAEALSPWLPGWRIQPSVATDDSGRKRRLEVRLWEGSDSDRVVAELAKLGATRIVRRESSNDVARILFDLSPAGAASLAELDDVAWIEPAPVVSTRLNTATWIVQSNQADTWSLWDRSLTGEGQILGHLDDRIDPDVCYLFDSAVPNNSPGPNHRKVLKNYDPGLIATNHGTRTAAAAVGLREDQSTDNAGVARGARMVHGWTGNVGGLGDMPSELKTALVRAQNDGAYVHTNSWGDNDPNLRSYTFWSRDIDDYSWENEDGVVLFAIANQDFQTPLVLTPENAKNCVAVSASLDTNRQHQWGIGTNGPTSDGRLKPEIMAPGVSIALPNNGTQNCSTGPGTGTSFATPLVAGVALLIRQYFMEGYHPTGAAVPGDAYTPSGALIRAMLLNGTADMTGVDAQGGGGAYDNDFPNVREGWGRALAENALFFAGERRGLRFVDRRHAEGLSHGETETVDFTVASPDEPLHVTLVWTDPPAEHAAAVVIVNDLDLEVGGPGETTYLGNVFSGSQSAPGGGADRVNTVEQVRLANPPAGPWSLTVRGHNVPEGPQGFAVVITAELADGNTEEVWYVY